MVALFAISFSLLLISLAGLIHAFYKLCETEKISWVMPTLCLLLVFIGMFVSTIVSGELMDEPTSEDVIKGHAAYREDMHIKGNDTIKTYTIEWQKKTCD